MTKAPLAAIGWSSILVLLACRQGPGSASDASGSGGAPLSDCAPVGQARNPIVTHRLAADPSAKVFRNRVYVYTSHDADGQTAYDMVDYHAYSSDDLANWQDHGVLIETADLPWATRLYAPDACEKNGKYYLYMPDADRSIGVAVADDPGGPFVDPLGVPLITESTPGAEDVDWRFDPTCFVDDDGQGYLYFGGGPIGTGDNARVIRLADDMVSLLDAVATTLVVPDFFEASFLHKRGDTYYFSYSTTFENHAAHLDYMTSQSPMSGFVYQGTLLSNGDINMNRNSHGSVVEFAGKSYLFYHNRKLEQDLGGTNSFQRTSALQELSYTEQGAIVQMEMSTQDTTVAQIKCLDGFSGVEAESMAAQQGIEVEGKSGARVRVTDIDPSDWVLYSQVDFRQGAARLVASVASATSGGVIDVRIDGCGDRTGRAGVSIGTCQVASTGDTSTFAEASCSLTPTSGPHDLCLVFSGDASFELDSFRLE